MPAKFSNNASSSLVGSISSGSTALSVVPGDGSKFPLLAAGEWFVASLVKLVAGAPVVEIVKVTARAADVLTIVRAQEGTAAQSFSAGDKIDLRLTAASLSGFAQVDSPKFTGAPEAPTPAAGDSSKRIVNTEFLAGASVASAGSAAILQTARSINGVPFDGSQNITIADATKEPAITAGSASQYRRGDKTWQTLDKAAVGLGSADNTADANKPVSTPQAAALLAKSGGTMTGPVLFADGSMAAPSIAFAESGNDTGFYHIGDGQIGVVCNGVLVGKFSPTGFESIKVTQTQ